MSQAAADRYAWAEPGVEDLGGGLYRIPLPLPLDGLKAVNVYAITGPGGVDLIDAGIAVGPASETLAAGLRTDFDLPRWCRSRRRVALRLIHRRRVSRGRGGARR